MRRNYYESSVSALTLRLHYFSDSPAGGRSIPRQPPRQLDEDARDKSKFVEPASEESARQISELTWGGASQHLRFARTEQSRISRRRFRRSRLRRRDAAAKAHHALRRRRRRGQLGQPALDNGSAKLRIWRVASRGGNSGPNFQPQPRGISTARSHRVVRKRARRTGAGIHAKRASRKSKWQALNHRAGALWKLIRGARSQPKQANVTQRSTAGTVEILGPHSTLPRCQPTPHPPHATA